MEMAGTSVDMTGLAVGFVCRAIAGEGGGTLGDESSERPLSGIDAVSLEAVAISIGIGLAIGIGIGLAVGIGSGEVSATGLAWPSGRMRRWPTMSLLASWMPLRAARLAVVVP